MAWHLADIHEISNVLVFAVFPILKHICKILFKNFLTAIWNDYPVINSVILANIFNMISPHASDEYDGLTMTLCSGM